MGVRRLGMAGVCVGLLLGAACSSDDDDDAPPNSQAGTSGTDAGIGSVERDAGVDAGGGSVATAGMAVPEDLLPTVDGTCPELTTGSITINGTEGATLGGHRAGSDVVLLAWHRRAV